MDRNLDRASALPRSRRRLSRLKRAIAFAFPYKRAVLGILGFTLLLAGINAAEPLVLKYIFDGIGNLGGTGVLITGVAWLAGLGLVREVATAFSNWLTWHTRLGLHYGLLEATVSRLHRLPLS